MTSQPNLRMLSGRECGFTLIELMIVVALIAVTLGVGMPAFRDFTLSAALKSYANDLALHSQLARSEAIKRNKAVTLCMSANGTSCTTSGDWGQGWIVIEEGSGEVILHRQAVREDFRVAELSAGVEIAFSATGLKAPSATSVFRVCRVSDAVGHEREVSITSTGRTSVKYVKADEVEDPCA